MENEDDEEGGSPGLGPELVKSYLAFARRAIADRRWLARTIFVVVVALSVAAVAVWPRSYASELRLLVQHSGVLEGDSKSNALDSASDVITRHEAIESLVDQLQIAKSWASVRSPPLRLKDRLMEAIRGKPSTAAMNEVLVSMLESRLFARVDGATLTIGAEWPDPVMAKRIVEAAKDSFLSDRHDIEISVIQEKMSILEGHAARLRTEIEGIAGDLSRLKEEKIAAAQKAVRQARQASSTVSAAPSPLMGGIRHAAPAASANVTEGPPGEDVTALREQLEGTRRKLNDLQSRRAQALLEAKGRLADLKLKFTDDHPEVRAMFQRIALLSAPAPEENALANDVETLESRVKRANGIYKADSPLPARGGGGPASPAAPTSEPLPTDILRLLEAPEEMDPAVSTQLSTAIGKYSELRSEIRNERILLDTAQAAFNRRYNIVSPATVPTKPSKPKIPLVIAAGVLVGLLLALLVPVLLELKQDVVIERWQVHMLKLPILGEVRVPPLDK